MLTFCNENGILPLLESTVNEFATRFAQAGKYIYNYMLQVIELTSSRYTEEPEGIIVSLEQTMHTGLDVVRKELSTLEDDRVAMLMLDAIDVLDNFIKQASMSTSALDPNYYIMEFEAYINVSVCMSAFWAIKTSGRHPTDEIKIC